MRLVDALAEEDLGDLDVGIAGIAEHGLDDALGVLVRQLGEAGDRRHRRGAVLAAERLVARGGRWARGCGVVRLEPRALPATAQRARDARAAPLDDAQHLALEPAARSGGDAHGDLVAVERAAHGLGRDVDVVGEPDGRDEAEAARDER